MRSTLLAWLLFAPLIGMMTAYLSWTLSQWPPAKWLAIGCLIWVILFALTAFVANIHRK